MPPRKKRRRDGTDVHVVSGRVVVEETDDEGELERKADEQPVKRKQATLFRISRPDGARAVMETAPSTARSESAELERMKLLVSQLYTRLESYIETDDSLISTSQLSPAADDGLGSPLAGEELPPLPPEEAAASAAVSVVEPSLLDDAPPMLASQESVLSTLSEIDTHSQLERLCRFFDTPGALDDFATESPMRFSGEPPLAAAPPPPGEMDAASSAASAAAAASAAVAGHARPKVGVAALVVCPSRPGCVLLGKRLKAPGVGTYALPGGHLEYGERWEDTARRELEEETALVVKDWTLWHVSNDFMGDDRAHYVTIWMKGSCAEDAEARLVEPDKCAGWEWHPWDSLPSPMFEPFQDVLAKGMSPFVED